MTNEFILKIYMNQRKILELIFFLKKMIFLSSHAHPTIFKQFCIPPIKLTFQNFHPPTKYLKMFEVLNMKCLNYETL